MGTGSGDKLCQFASAFNTTALGVDGRDNILQAKHTYAGSAACHWAPIDFDKDSVQDTIVSAMPGPLHTAVLISAGVIEHLRFPDRLLDGIVALLAQGAYAAVISTNWRHSEVRWSRPVVKEIYEVGHPLAVYMGPPNNNKHVREWSPWEFSRFLESKGLSIVYWTMEPCPVKSPLFCNMVFVVATRLDEKLLKLSRNGIDWRDVHTPDVLKQTWQEFSKTQKI